MRGFCILFFLFFSALHAFPNGTNDSLIAVLKKEIDQKDIYVQNKLLQIDLLRKKLARVQVLTLPQQFDLYNDFYHQYKTFIYDSAFKYAEKLIETAYKLNDKTRIGYARVKLSFVLISSGMFKETFDSLNVVEVSYLADSTKANYYWLLARTYSDLNVYNKDHHYRKYYTDLNQQFIDSALAWCEPESYWYYYLTAVKNIQISNYEKVVSTIHTLLDKHTLTDPQLAVNYYDLGNAYRGLNNIEKCIQYTIMSSLSDIRTANKETAAMYTLARQLYTEGDVKNAYIFIKQAVDDAAFYGAHQRMAEIGHILPVIASAEVNNAESKEQLWLRYVIGLSILSLLVMMFAFIIFIQLRKLKVAEMRITQANHTLQEINNKLTEANKIKEEYIGYYFSVNSEYVDKIESLKRSVEQKLQSKKYDDIKFILNGINAKRDRDELCPSQHKTLIFFESRHLTNQLTINFLIPSRQKNYLYFFNTSCRFLVMRVFLEPLIISKLKRMSKLPPKQTMRRFEFIGDFKNDSIVIGNYGDAALVARGNFDLSGLIYCGKNTVEMEIAGDGLIAFKGVCRRLMIKRVEGNCRIDLSNLTTETVWCESARGKSVVTLGKTKTIELLSLDEDALVRYEGKPVLLNYSLRGNSKIEGWKSDL